MRVKLLYFDGCPHWKLAEERLRAAAALGPEAVEIELVKVESPEEGDRIGFGGSPTLLIEDVDPFRAPGATGSFGCRMYVTESGLEGAPSTTQLRALLSQGH